MDSKRAPARWHSRAKHDFTVPNQELSPEMRNKACYEIHEIQYSKTAWKPVYETSYSAKDGIWHPGLSMMLPGQGRMIRSEQDVRSGNEIPRKANLPEFESPRAYFNSQFDLIIQYFELATGTCIEPLTTRWELCGQVLKLGRRQGLFRLCEQLNYELSIAAETQDHYFQAPLSYTKSHQQQNHAESDVRKQVNMHQASSASDFVAGDESSFGTTTDTGDESVGHSEKGIHQITDDRLDSNEEDEDEDEETDASSATSMGPTSLNELPAEPQRSGSQNGLFSTEKGSYCNGGELIALSGTEAEAICTRASSLLQTIKEWTMRTGDLSVLQSISATIKNLAPEAVTLAPSSGSATPTERGPASKGRSGKQPLSCSSSHSPVKHHSDKTTGAKRINRSGPNVKAANKSGCRQSKLRCPCFSNGGLNSCRTLHKTIRDLVRHLRSHSFFFCYDCSQHRLQQQDYKDHACDRVCIDLACVNHRRGVQIHPHQDGCPFSFRKLDRASKWYALFKLVNPASALPSWDDVCVTIDDTAELTPHGTEIVPELTQSQGLPNLAPRPSVDVSAGPSNSPEPRDSTYGERGSLIDRDAVQNMADQVVELFRQMTTIIGTNQEQNRHILEQRVTISQQSQQITEQNERLSHQEHTITQQSERFVEQESTISTLQRQMEELQNQVAYLSVQLPFPKLAQNDIEHSDSDGNNALMEVDSHDDLPVLDELWVMDAEYRVNQDDQWATKPGVDEFVNGRVEDIKAKKVKQTEEFGCSPA